MQIQFKKGKQIEGRVFEVGEVASVPGDLSEQYARQMLWSGAALPYVEAPRVSAPDVIEHRDPVIQKPRGKK